MGGMRGQEKCVLGKMELSTVWLGGNSELFRSLRGPCKKEGCHLLFMVLCKKKKCPRNK